MLCMTLCNKPFQDLPEFTVPGYHTWRKVCPKRTDFVLVNHLLPIKLQGLGGAISQAFILVLLFQEGKGKGTLPFVWCHTHSVGHETEPYHLKAIGRWACRQDLGASAYSSSVRVLCCFRVFQSPYSHLGCMLQL